MEIEAAVFAGRGTQQVKQATTPEEAAREFEAMMLVELLKAARKAGDAFGVQNDDNGARSYQEFADEHLAKALAAQDALGFSRLVIRQLQPTASSSPDLPERPQ